METVGDCYVAVCGLPDPRPDHAVVMARFARDCLYRMHELSRRLEVVLGPGTAELSMRIGLHSGPGTSQKGAFLVFPECPLTSRLCRFPAFLSFLFLFLLHFAVTAGVLRGERSRFQLFGDTVNTASRMESTGEVNRIHLSEDTAKLLTDAGKEHWLSPREQAVAAKGKGLLSTFWLKRPGDSSSSAAASARLLERNNNSSNSPLAKKAQGYLASLGSPAPSSKVARFIDWHVEVLYSLLKQIVRRRRMLTKRQPKKSKTAIMVGKIDESSVLNKKNSSSIWDEVDEVIQLPRLDTNKTHGKGSKYQQDDDDDEAESSIPETVVEEVRHYITELAHMYHDDNPFHNFEHASHVAMSVVKLLSRIVAPSELDYANSQQHQASKTLHDHTYGITSDPLTQFSCVLSALIHDVDHPGVPNVQLVKEGHFLASRFHGKSVAEQNSVHVAWELLMQHRFATLRATLYQSEQELQRFRQLVVNSVMATDIVDKELKALRNDRWSKAFTEDVVAVERGGHEMPMEDQQRKLDRKATIVIEHLIQASDVAHTMQHWHVYRKWNERFFRECYQAYQDGRAETNPADNWYQGEIGFFDFYIVPLAKKLKECGVFGVSSDEYLNYATRNRDQWLLHGREIVATMVETIHSEAALQEESNRADRMSLTRKLSPDVVAEDMDPTEDPTESTWTEGNGWTAFAKI